MRQDDARKLDHSTLEAMRIRAVRSVQAGENPEVVARSLRISRRTIYEAGAISARWMGRVEGQAVVWEIAQTECARPAMGLQDRYGEESFATEVCVRAMDARHGGQADQGQVWRRVERQFGWSVVGATRHHLPEAFVSCAGARRGSGRAMAQEEISEDQGPGAAGKSGDLLWRCRPHALGSSRGAQLGPEGRNAVVEATGARHGMSLISAITSRGQM